MRNYSALGLIFANMHDESFRDGTAVRSMGSLPFGGRYRLIDFPLSAMVNAGITKVGVITKSNYQSLMDHLGSGKAWDLSRKNEGLYFLPPRSSDDAMYQGRIGSLVDVIPFLNHSKEELVILADCHMVTSMDYDALIKAHVDSGADVTMVCRHGAVPKLADIPVLTMDASCHVTDLLLGRIADQTAYYGTGVYVMRKDWLLRTITEAAARNLYHFERDILQRRLDELKICGYVASSLVMPIYSTESYFNANLALLEDEVRSQLFPHHRPVYTKLKDCDPVQYGLHAEVTNCLVGDGAHVDGKVKNSIIFRGVKISRHAQLENCVVMQNVTVGDHCKLSNIIVDKNVAIRGGVTLQGSESYPVYIAKNSIV
ncbi:MAG: glucose-1-phosphate adenylyltransferase subunit GlgD [Clostridia bacterium]|nr:glucose-1-phosphate adenylyltransferase subunit GlgD [Clostridia bacterium]